MVKRFNKKRINSKTINFKIPESFSSLNFNQKIIAVTLIVLVVGIIGSLFPGNVTGSVVNPLQPFELFKGLLSGANDLIKSTFGVFFPGENVKEIYTRFVLFSFIAIGVFVLAGLFIENALLKLLFGIGLGYLFTIYIPIQAILGIGILYSSIVTSLLLFVPLIFFWYAANHLKKSKLGYVLRTIIFGFMLILIFSTSSLLNTTSAWSNGILLILMLFVLGSFLWSFFKIFTVNPDEEYKEATVEGVASWIQTYGAKVFARGAATAAKRETKKRVKKKTPLTWKEAVGLTREGD